MTQESAHAGQRTGSKDQSLEIRKAEKYTSGEGAQEDACQLVHVAPGLEVI
jgi:hypothetical protein